MARPGFGACGPRARLSGERLSDWRRRWGVPRSYVKEISSWPCGGFGDRTVGFDRDLDRRWSRAAADRRFAGLGPCTHLLDSRGAATAAPKARHSWFAPRLACI